MVFRYDFKSIPMNNIYIHVRGAVVEWLEQLGYGAESRCIS